MSLVVYAFLVAIWLAGFAVGYWLRSYLSHRRRMRGRRERHQLPETREEFTSIPGRATPVTTLVPEDRPMRPQQGTGDGRKSSAAPIRVSDASNVNRR